jgi:O-antigen ligase
MRVSFYSFNINSRTSQMATSLIAIAIIVGIAALLMPEFAILLFLVVPLVKLFLKLIAPITRTYDLTAAVMVVLAISLGLHIVRHGVSGIRWPGKMIAGLIGLLAILLFSYIYTPAPDYGYDKLIRTVIALPVGFLAPIIYLRTDPQARRLLLYILVSAVVVSLGTIFGSGPTYSEVSGRATFLESNPLSTAAAIAYGAVIAVVWLFDGERRALLRILMLPLVPLCILGVFYTGSRGPLVGLALVLAFFLFRERHALKFHHYAIMGIVAAAGAFAVITYLPAEYWRRFAFLTGESHGAAFTSGRPQLWAMAITQGLSSPLWGQGIGAFSIIPKGAGPARLLYPHNMLLELFSEQGLIGMGLGTLLLTLPFVVGWRQLKLLKGHPLSGTALTFFLLYLVSFIDAMKSGDLSDNRRMWFFMGCIFGMENIIYGYWAQWMQYQQAYYENPELYADPQWLEHEQPSA